MCAWDALLRAALKGGALVHSAIKLRSSESGQRGLFVDESVPQGTVLVHLPEALMVKVGDVPLPPFSPSHTSGAHSLVHLAFALLAFRQDANSVLASFWDEGFKAYMA
eukprot:4184490-Amphidinium_carterae.1